MNAAPEPAVDFSNGHAKFPKAQAAAPKSVQRTSVSESAVTPSAPGLPVLTLPYLEFSHVLMRAVDVRAMAEANRKLTDAMREVVRRQQDLAWELAETTLKSVGISAGAPRADAPGEVFDRAAAAVRELGEALIDAQIGALRTLQTETDSAEKKE